MSPEQQGEADAHSREQPYWDSLIADEPIERDDCPCLPGAPEHVHGAGGYAVSEASS